MASRRIPLFCHGILVACPEYRKSEPVVRWNTPSEPGFAQEYFYQPGEVRKNPSIGSEHHARILRRSDAALVAYPEVRNLKRVRTCGQNRTEGNNK